jgi:hypothetical protein
MSSLYKSTVGKENGDTSAEPRWPALISLLAAAGLYCALPEWLSIGPNWLLPLLVLMLLIPMLFTYRSTSTLSLQIHRNAGFVTSSVLTTGLVWSLGRLIWSLVLAPASQRESAKYLLFSAGTLWITNVLVFALWYWRLDAGGPDARDLRRSVGHVNGAFLFPQMLQDNVVWTPEFVDYLFLAFNSSTALSPTDTAVLSRWAKILMMIQSAISLMVIALLASRAVNIL